MDGTTPTGSKSTDSWRLDDEEALRAVFREHYTPLVRSAFEVLGETAVAARVVERSFVALWKDRERITSPEVLETYLAERVYDGAIRERARRESLHRAERNLGIVPPATSSRLTGLRISVDDAWMHALGTIHPREDQLATRSAAVRREAAHHIAKVGSRRAHRGALGGAVVIAAVALMGTWWISRRSDEALRRGAEVTATRIVATRAGQRASTTLEDGSRIAVGAATTLQVPEGFGRSTRTLELDGTAAFTIAEGAHPFTAKVAGMSVVATGTAFAVRAYAGEGRLVVRVDDGEVEVRTKSTRHALRAGQTVAFYGGGERSNPSPRESIEALGWTNGTFLIERRPLRDALPELARWFKLDLEVREAALLDRPITIETGLDSPKAVVEALEKGGRVRVVQEKSRLVLYDAAPR